MKYIILFLTLACGGFPLSLRAGPPSDSSIEQMLKVMKVDQMVDEMMNQMESGMRTGMDQGLKQALKGQTPTLAQQAQIDEMQKKMVALFRDELSYAKMKDVYLQVYRETFTQEEINSIIAF